MFTHIPTQVPGTTKLLIMLPNEVTSSCMDSLLNFIYSGNIDLNLKKPKACKFTRKNDNIIIIVSVKHVYLSHQILKSADSGTATRKSKRKLLKMKVSEGMNKLLPSKCRSQNLCQKCYYQTTTSTTMKAVM